MRRTKIIATIGPKSSDEAVLRRMLEAGMDVARLNFSHGTQEGHERSFRLIRKLSSEMRRPVGIIADLQGPKIRTGELATDPLNVRTGSTLIITTEQIKGSNGRISTTYRRLHRDVKPGDRILLDDGSIEVTVKKISGRDIYCRVVSGGVLGARKGINLPGIKVSEPTLTRKDKEDITFAAALGVDFFAISFVRQPDDINRLRALLQNLKCATPIIAKIEKPEALDNIDDIISVSDGIMVARGDLGVEMPPEKVPQIQKELIGRCNQAGKPVITATQMLESMIHEATPTRAEASDIVNAIYDGTSAVMLSGETAIGDYPVLSVKTMAKIAEEADIYVIEKEKKIFRRSTAIDSFEDAIGQATQTTSRHLPTRLIVCFTSSGFTAQHIASYRPEAPIIAVTQHKSVQERVSLYWGVQSILVEPAETVDRMIERVKEELLKRAMVRRGDSIIITAGYPLGVSGMTNMMQLVRVGGGKRLRKARGKQG
ncbi:MAG: pyruvate kinase [Candidatus Abyssobacteria bacterium SURF_5]|uniref:Pyruvate kinase n=1 Tax=Abyssobacteria bacterium (strain SURF_5) TaxID=2093360 RepID=A0A3A4NFI5_ABYX5|nr:MAG: pyruvate kinase [Candidatus Abyssubacteria bacterium SURF_5]